MKILTIAPYIYNTNYPEHQKNKTGFGIIISKIIDSLSNNGHEVYVLTHALCKSRSNGFVHIIKHRVIDIIYCLKAKEFISRDIISIFKKVRYKDIHSLKMLRLVYYYIDSGYVEHVIKSIRPDIVHIHGLGSGTINYINVCKRMHIPFIVTIHGLLQNNQTVSELELAIEREFLLISEHKKYSVTVVSSGIKKRLIGDYYKLRNAENVVVIPNGIDISLKPPSVDIRKKFGVPLSGRLCIAVGSVCRGKNQIQILRALAAMPDTFIKNVWLIIIGKISKDYPIMKEAEKLGLDDRVFFTGFVEHEDIHNYYAAADINIVASKEEGFGLSIIEGFVYGVPTVAFSDLDAIQDVYDEKAMILCDERNDEAFAKAIMHACETQWDREAIRQHSKKFSDEAMAEKYIRVFAMEIAKND